MRRMTLEEQQKVVETLAREHWNAGMMKVDAICYGGDQECRQYGDAERFINKAIQAFPKDIIEAFNASIRKAEADKLREKADAIERGELTE